jgi:hypothetical protein
MNWVLSGIIGFAAGGILAKIDDSNHTKTFKRSVKLLVILEWLAAIFYVTIQLR